MKTYNIIYVLLALLIIGCSSSDEVSGAKEIQNSVEADYAVLLTKESKLTSQLLTATSEMIALNLAQSAFGENSIPQLTRVQNSKFIQYHKQSACSGKITTFDFQSDKLEEISVFDDLNDCDLTANAISFSDDKLFIAYELALDEEARSYMARIIDLSAAQLSFVDIDLNNKPVDLAVANNRLFILTLDTQVSNENFLTVIDLSSNALLIEKNLGFRAARIFTNMDDDIIISYDELHTTLNSATMSELYTNYQDGTEPRFTTNSSDNFDLDGNLYYPRVSVAESSYEKIAAVYDFGNKKIVAYAYENFLNEAERDLEFEIETTTTVHYDDNNGMILIGYKKVGKQEGGIVRIKPAPEPEFIDNIDLDGVPYEIFIN